MTDIIKNILPPFVLDMYRRLKRYPVEFRGPYLNWESAQKDSLGYDNNLILDKVINATLKVQNGKAIFERDSVVFNHKEYDDLILLGIMTAAALDSGKLNIIDYGGALGSSFFQHKFYLNKLVKYNWNIIEQSHYVQAGIKHINDSNIQFYTSLSECVKNQGKPSAVLISATLQYLQNPLDLLDNIKKIMPKIIILDKLIVNIHNEHKIYIQDTHEPIYEASYPCRSLPFMMINNLLESEYSLEFECDSLPFPQLKYINSEFKGYLFVSKK